MKLKRNCCLLFGLTFLILLSCNSHKKVLLTGYAYQGDHMLIKDNNKVIFELKFDCGEASGGICTIHKNMLIRVKEKDVKLQIILNSNQHQVIDTVVNILSRNKEPFISFIHPDEAKTRVLFVADDSKFAKY